ncbi:ATP synthase F(0) complex subunit B1, mitochondrial-like [Xenia sp. Carnegie-2017]|uniref:ATP synthase F(0) complex subunit B1, mitochondrial-like n=1 Tax=Xenia sp. Carnegie-2017 TaxID=2897299 RepID=UPI001F04EDE2|nr:ATP synthase F(0) complex subunit B1, mitochondrial-like [Xenia sp. Carnegie-2017]
MFSCLTSVLPKGGQALSTVKCLARPGSVSLARFFSTSDSRSRFGIDPTGIKVMPTNFFSDVKAELFKKTGESGPLCLGIGFAAYLLSKEYFIIHEETLLAVVSLLTMTWALKKAGPPITQMLDDYAQEILDQLNQGRVAKIAQLEEEIKLQESVEPMLKVGKDVFEILQENNVMEMETEYRSRLHHVHNEVKKRLDYQVELQDLKKRLEQEHIINWVKDAVVKSITPMQEKQTITQCIKELKSLAPA